MPGRFPRQIREWFLICAATLTLAGWLAGLSIALQISLPSAVSTKACAPILGTGAVGGITLGIIRTKFGRKCTTGILILVCTLS